MPFGSFSAGRHYSFSDSVLGQSGQIQEVRTLVGVEPNFVPTGIHVNSSTDEDEELSGVATVVGWLVGENRTMADTYKVYTKTPVGLAFAGIFSDGTTARGIKSISGI
jgi:hypothetical protein